VALLDNWTLAAQHKRILHLPKHLNLNHIIQYIGGIRADFRTTVPFAVWKLSQTSHRLHHGNQPMRRHMMQALATTPDLSRHRLRFDWRLVLLFAAVLAIWAVGPIAAGWADARLVREAMASANLYEAVLKNALERFRVLPLVLATDGEVAAALQVPDPAQRHLLDLKLARLAASTSAAAIYVIDPQGRTIAASNSETPESFVGRDFRFRDYFAAAMLNGRGEQFALGTASHRPGLYLSSRVDHDGQALGVVVTKIDFSGLEAEWRRAKLPVYVTGAHSLVLITSVEPWRFQTAAQLPIRPLPGQSRLVSAAIPDRSRSDYVAITTAAATPGWNLTLLWPRNIGGVVAAARAVTALTLALAALGLWAGLRRRDLAAAARAAAQLELEGQVAARTHELSDANHQLTLEMAERQRAEAALLLLHFELEQANRLTMLGQVAAGVAHEINQPVAAIAAWSHNAVQLLAMGNTASATDALNTIGDLTTRIGRITGELRDFARKSDGLIMPVRVDDAINGALMLVSARQLPAGVQIHRKTKGSLQVLADRVRLEQVLVNLLQNALESVEGGLPGASVTIEAARSGTSVRLTVSDTGPGVTPAIAATLFTPFQTSKTRGLGLGLVISRDICRALGGDLVLKPPGQGSARGATFIVTLPAGPA
jgi:two-component system C4-dicarboxylate transport sensor histidine kinase DctB